MTEQTNFKFPPRQQANKSWLIACMKWFINYHSQQSKPRRPEWCVEPPKFFLGTLKGKHHTVHTSMLVEACGRGHLDCYAVIFKHGWEAWVPLEESNESISNGQKSIGNTVIRPLFLETRAGLIWVADTTDSSFEWVPWKYSQISFPFSPHFFLSFALFLGEFSWLVLFWFATLSITKMDIFKVAVQIRGS